MKVKLAIATSIAIGIALLVSPSVASPVKVDATTQVVAPVVAAPVYGQPQITLVRQEELRGACLYTTVANIKYCRDGTNFLCDRWLFGTITGRFYEGQTCSDLRAEGIDTGNGD